VLLLKVPGPVRVHVTPASVLSLVRVAIIVAVWPGFSDVSFVDSVTVIAPLPEQPEKASEYTRIPTTNKPRGLNFLTVSPLKVVTISLRNSKPLEREQNLQINPSSR